MDLKIDNVLLKRGEVVLADFGRVVSTECCTCLKFVEENVKWRKFEYHIDPFVRKWGRPVFGSDIWSAGVIALSLFLRIDMVQDKEFYNEIALFFFEELEREISKVLFNCSEIRLFCKELSYYGYDLNYLQVICSYTYCDEMILYRFLKCHLIHFLKSRGIFLDDFFWKISIGLLKCFTQIQIKGQVLKHY